MLGQTIEAKNPIPIGILGCVLITIALAAIACATWNIHYLMGCALPATMVLLYWFGRPDDAVVSLEERGIVQFGSQHVLRYDTMQAVYLGNLLLSTQSESPSDSTRGAITIVHEAGELVLPERMNVSPAELGQFLASRLPQQSEKEIPPALTEFATEQITSFGPDKVFAIHQRPNNTDAIRHSTTKSVGKALALTGVVWLVASSLLTANHDKGEPYAAWTVFGFLAIFLGALLWLFGRLRNTKHNVDTMKYGESCIIISPSGLALAQGDLQGKLRWDEIKNIKNGPRKSLSTERDEALHLDIAGGEIIVFDIYDRPIVEIASLISKHTRKPIGC